MIEHLKACERERPTKTKILAGLIAALLVGCGASAPTKKVTISFA
jgi:hypothetical protein